MDNLDKVVAKRNRRLKEFFAAFSIKVRIIGDKNAPSVIWNDECALSCYVHNFNLHFTDEPFNGKIIKTFKLTEEVKAEMEDIKYAIGNANHRPVYKIYLKGSTPNLYLCGYNYEDKQNSIGRYPVFSAVEPKIYFSKEKSTDITDELRKFGYDLVVV